MSVTLKKDSWKIKDPNTGEYRDSTVFSSTFAEDVTDIVADATAAIDAQEIRAAGIVSDAQNDIDTIAAAVQSMTQTGTDTTLTVSGAAADSKAVGDEVSELKTDVIDYSGIVYTETTYKENFYVINDGSEVSNTSWKIIDIDVKNCDFVMYEGIGNLGNAPTSVFLSSANTVVSSHQPMSNRNFIPVPENSVTFRISVRKTSTPIIWAIKTGLFDKTAETYLTADDFMLGDLEEGTGRYLPYTTRLVLKGYIFCPKGTVITRDKTGMNFSFWEYSFNNFQYITKAQGWNDSYTTQNDCLLKIQTQSNDSSLVSGKWSFSNNKLSVPFGYYDARPLFYLIDSSKQYSVDINKKVPNGIKQFSHRGYRIGIPESTEPAFITSYYMGYCGFEGDVRATSDGVYVISHSEVMPTNGSVIAETTYQNLISNDSMGEYNGETLDILTVEELIHLAKIFDMYCLLDFKIELNSTTINSICGYIRNAGMEKKVVWLCSAVRGINVRSVYSDALIGINVTSAMITSEMQTLNAYRDRTFVYPKYDIITDANVETWRTAGFNVVPWFVDFRQEGFTSSQAIEKIKELISKNIDGITVDQYVPTMLVRGDLYKKYGITINNTI